MRDIVYTYELISFKLIGFISIVDIKYKRLSNVKSILVYLSRWVINIVKTGAK